jgi:hypothetical protein
VSKSRKLVNFRIVLGSEFSHESTLQNLGFVGLPIGSKSRCEISLESYFEATRKDPDSEGLTTKI